MASLAFGLYLGFALNIYTYKVSHIWPISKFTPASTTEAIRSRKSSLLMAAQALCNKGKAKGLKRSVSLTTHLS